MMNYFTQYFMMNVDANQDGIISSQEYQNYLKTQNMPLNMATKAVTIFEKDGNAGFSKQEMFDAFTSYDDDSNGTLNFGENINLQNDLSGITIDPTMSQNQYNSLFSNSVNFFRSADTNKDSVITLDEIQTYLNNNNLDTSTATAFLNFYNQGGSSFNILQYQKKSIALDLNSDGRLDTTELYTLKQQNIIKPLSELQISAKKFIKTLDGNTGVKDANNKVIKDGVVDEAEFQTYLKSQRMPVEVGSFIAMDAKVIDKDGNGTITEQEMTAFYELADGDDNDKLDLTEQIEMQNVLTQVFIDPAKVKDQNQYNALLSTSAAFIRALDTERDALGNLTLDGEISRNEIKNYLASYNLDSSDTAVDKYVAYFDANFNGPDGKMDIQEYLKKLVDLDINQDGKLSSTTTDSAGNITLGERDALDKLVTPLSGVEIGAKNFIKALDGTKDEKGKIVVGSQNGAINYTEYSTYLANNNMPASMALKVLNEYDTITQDGELSYDEMVAAYQKFDLADAKTGLKDGTLSFNEQIAFQNSISEIQFDTTMTQAQYTALYKAGQSFMKLDLDKDGAVDVNEYKAALLTPNAKTGAAQPEYYAENLMMLFDQDQSTTTLKDNKIDLFEYMKGLMTFDKNNDGTLNAVESLNLKNQFDNKRLFDSVNETFTESDFDNDKLISKTEYQDFLVSEGFSASLADAAITQFDQDKDESFSHLELMQAYKQFDVNNNNTLDSDEKLLFYSDLTNSAVNLGLTPSNVNQYKKMFETAKNDIKEISIDNGDGDNSISISEFKNYLAKENVPEYIATNLITKYGTNGNLDIVELMKMNIESDTNANGALELNEKLALYEKASSVALNATPANETQYAAIYDELKQYFAEFDANKDQTLDAADLKKYFASKGFSENLVDGFLNDYDSVIDNKIDILEFMKAYIDADTDDSGKLELSEELAFNSDLAGVTLNANISNEKQYISLYPEAAKTVKAFDITSDQQLNESELGTYFVSKGFSASLAQEALNLYDASKDGSLDTFELLKANIDFDTNPATNGVIDSNEQLIQFAKFAQIDLSAVAGNTTQINGNSQAALNVLKTYDLSKDNNLSQDEARSYFKAAFTMPNYMADNFIAQNDSNKDGKLNNFELMKGFIDSDINKSGTLEFAEKINMYANLSGVDVNVTEDNLQQTTTIYNNAVANLKYDLNGDKNLSSTELGTYFKTLGLPQYMADNFIAQNDNNKDGSIDTIELTNAYMNIDHNQNGSILDFEDLMKLKSQASGVNIEVTEDNLKQTTALYNYANSILKNDINGDKNLSSTDLGAYFKTLGLPQYMADNFIAQNDNNKDGSIDIMELTNAYINIDQNKNGTIDFTDLMKLKSQASGINIEVTEDNLKQTTALYNYATSNFKNDINGDKNLSVTETRNLLKSFKMTDTMVDNFIAQNDNNKDGSIDIMELTNAFKNLDINKSGAIDTAERINLLQDSSKIDLTSGYASSVSLAGIYNTTAKLFNYDLDKDLKMDVTEFETYLSKSGYTAIQIQNAKNKFNSLDINSDGFIDYAEWMKTLENFDVNKNGIWEAAENTALKNSLSL